MILGSPAVPVKERDCVTLCCRIKKTFSKFKADFYKNGHFFRGSSTGELTIHRVSKSDEEGFYKCRIFGAGESPERQLSVKAETMSVNCVQFYTYWDNHQPSHQNNMLAFFYFCKPKICSNVYVSYRSFIHIYSADWVDVICGADGFLKMFIHCAVQMLIVLSIGRYRQVGESVQTHVMQQIPELTELYFKF